MTPKERAAMQQALKMMDAGSYIPAMRVLREALDHYGEADEMVGCAYCNNPLFAGTKCNNCGFITLAEQAEPNSTFMEGYRIGLAEMREKCATVVTEHAPTCSPHWVSYVAAIRAIKFEGDTGFRPVSEMIAEHKQAEQEPIILKFPRQNKNGWTIDWKTISSVEDAIEDNEFKPCPEGVEQVLLALEKVYPATQPVSQEPVGTAGELFTLSTLERLDVRPSTKVYLDSTPPVAEIVLKSCIYFDSIDFSQKPPFLRYDTGDSTPQDNWNVYCDIQDELREFGYELTDSDVDHDTVCGDVTPMAAAIRNRGAK